MWIVLAAAAAALLVAALVAVLSPRAGTKSLDSQQEAKQKEAMEPKHKHPLAGKYVSDSPAWKRLWIVTGGQTGVDRAALDVALALDLPVRGWCPKNRIAEDGRIADRYPLQECASEDPALRTELNAFDSDATLVVSKGIPKDGTPLTEEIAKRYGKPFLCIDLDEELTDEAVGKFRAWIETNHIRVLNIGGPRESHQPGVIYARSRQILERLLRK
jgi:hypothetical protein